MYQLKYLKEFLENVSYRHLVEVLVFFYFETDPSSLLQRIFESSSFANNIFNLINIIFKNQLASADWSRDLCKQHGG